MVEKRIIVDGIETNYAARDDGTIWNLNTGREMAGTMARNEFRSIQLSMNGKCKSIMVHRLIAEAFCDNPRNYYIVHHINGDKYDNRAENLEWVAGPVREFDGQNYTPIIHADVEINDDWRSLDWIDPNFYVSKDGKIWNSRTKSFIRGVDRNGYLRASIYGVKYSIHRLVFQAFHGYLPKYIDHIDGNRANNSLENLREVTQSENMYQAMRNGHSRQNPVQQIDKEGNVVQEFRSCSNALEQLKIPTLSMLQSIIKNHKEYQGYYYRYKNDDKESNN